MVGLAKRSGCERRFGVTARQYFPVGEQLGDAMGDERTIRCPRTDDEVAALLNTKPDGWEYLLYGGALHVERAKLEEQYRDHALGYAELHGAPLDLHEAIYEVGAAFGDAQAMVATLMNMFDHERQERAFGRPGEPGDAELIQHLARRTVDGYAGLMEWARRLRSMRVPTEMQEAFRLAAGMMDTPVEEFREYVDQAVSQMDQSADLVAQADADPEISDDNPLVLTLQLTLTIDEDAVQRFGDELRRVETEVSL